MWRACRQPPPTHRVCRMEAVKIPAGGIKDASRRHRIDVPAPTLASWLLWAAAFRRLLMVLFAHVASTAHAASPVVGVSTAADGLTVRHVLGADVAYLVVRSEGAGDPLTLLLPTQSDSASGLAVFSRLGRLHARHWALVWGPGEPPATGVGFSSGDLRFRREGHIPGVTVGPAWVAVTDGVYRAATVDPYGPEPRWLPLAPSW